MVVLECQEAAVVKSMGRRIEEVTGVLEFESEEAVYGRNGLEQGRYRV